MPDTIASVLAYEADLTKTIQKTILRDLFVTEDKNAHTFRVKITRAGEPVDLTGATVTGYFMRYKDRVSIPLTGTVEGSEAVLTLKDGCYSTRTMFCVTLCVALGGAKHAVFAGEGKMVLNRSDAIVDPEDVIPSVEDIIAQYDLMVSGTNAANTAAGSANTAAGNANNAASNANTATSNANAATSRANTAAAAIEGMTVSASDVSAGTPASVEITDADGVKNIHFNLRQGITGVTPNITFQVATGAAGSQVQVSQSGTPENPVVNLTIPRGDTGAVDGVDYYEGNPAALGTASPGTANGLARGDHVHPMPSATDVGAAISVDGVQADATGNVAVGAVRYGAAQELTDEQKVQALANLGINRSEVASIKKLCEAGNFAPNATVTFSDAPINYDFFIARIGYRGSAGMIQGTGATATISLSSISGAASSTTIYAVRLQGDMTGKTFTVYQSYTSTIKADSTVFATPESVNIGPIYGVRIGGA